MTSSTLEKAFDSLTGFDVPGPASRFIQERQQTLLAADMEELASLRFSIVITARWESDRDEDPQRRAELRLELENLRQCYFDKIDRIAMAFGVAEAMHAKEEVERKVTLPLSKNFVERVTREEDDPFEI
jgi:hypothetical protein